MCLNGYSVEATALTRDPQAVGGFAAHHVGTVHAIETPGAPALRGAPREARAAWVFPGSQTGPSPWKNKDGMKHEVVRNLTPTELIFSVTPLCPRPGARSARTVMARAVRAERRLLDGRILAPVGETGGEVNAATRFAFSQADSLIWARYAGGGVRLGFLIGRIRRRRLEFRYVQMNDRGEVSAGHSVDAVVILRDGRVRLEEHWWWDTKPGEGRSVLEEIRSDKLATAIRGS
jgi:hypothetical protein